MRGITAKALAGKVALEAGAIGRMERTLRLVAAGSGSRAGGGIAKQYRAIGGKAVLAHAIDHLERLRNRRHPGRDRRRARRALYREAMGPRPPRPDHWRPRAPAFRPQRPGGARRRRGVRRCFVHDAARPFLPAEVIERLLAALDGGGGAVPVLPVTDTLARPATGLAIRSAGTAWSGSRRLRLFGSRRSWMPIGWHGDAATDDAQMAARGRYGVAAVTGTRGSRSSPTSRISPGPSICSLRPSDSRTGMGFDVHAFTPARALAGRCVHSQRSRPLPGIATPMSCSTRSPTPCSGRSAPATSAIIFRPATRNGVAPLPPRSSSMPER